LRRDSSDTHAVVAASEVAVPFPNSFRLRPRAAGGHRAMGVSRGLESPLLDACRQRARLGTRSRLQALVRAVGFPSGPAIPRLEAPSSARAAAAEVLQKNGWDGGTPLVALAPGAAYGGAKRWPSASFASLSDALAGDGIRSVLVGSQGDATPGKRSCLASERQRDRPCALSI
jgi:hypothetical protein